MALEGATPTRLGPRPRNNARGPSTSTIYLREKARVRQWRMDRLCLRPGGFGSCCDNCTICVPEVKAVVVCNLRRPPPPRW
ncbi:hypothetical protein E2C01_010403 [Portunus trituberculatus]|uniref:Uncharacterized protein n=1 Tax=Portunus trituberculatus TaxID=210409 RepID=A0A5B7D8J1_PORTR|nr:hypothetical protein [Portunus trituberculatus]